MGSAMQVATDARYVDELYISANIKAIGIEWDGATTFFQVSRGPAGLLDCSVELLKQGEQCRSSTCAALFQRLKAYAA